MARVEYEIGATPIIGHRTRNIFSQWKGIGTIRLHETFHDYAWRSNLCADHRNETDILVKSWQNDVSPAQKIDWGNYAGYLATLPTNYTKIIGWKQYGGVMSGMDAFILTSSLRFSIGNTDILYDPPATHVHPSPPLGTSVNYGDDPSLGIFGNTHLPPATEEGTFARVWIRGKRYAHLQLAAVIEFAPVMSFLIENLSYAKGGILPLQRDIYEVQLDTVDALGRFSEPTEIFVIQPYDTIELGLWDAHVWDALVWGNF
jgi:hypothetical protein